MRIQSSVGLAVFALSACLAVACGSGGSSTLPRSQAISAGDDEEGDGLARRMPQGPPEQGGADSAAAAAPAPAADFRPSLEQPPEAEPVAPDTTGAQDGAAWGAPEAQSGAPLPPRPRLKSAARSSLRDGAKAAKKGKWDEAVAAFERALEADPQAYEAAYDIGIVAERRGKPDEALAAYLRALKLQPDYELAVDATVRIHLRRGDPERALAFARPIAEAWQRNLALQAILANVLIARGQLDEAEAIARAALVRNERFVPAMVALANAAIARSRMELADSILEQALAIDANNADVHFAIGRRHQQEGRLSQAVASYKRAVELRPDYCEARMALALQYMAAGNYAEALAEFETLARLAPGLPAVRLNLGDAQRVNRHFRTARRTLENVAKEDHLPEAHYNLGLLYLEAGAEYPGLSLLETLQRAQTEFTAYREAMGARLAKDDASAGHLADVQRLLERERKRIEREEARKKRTAEAP